MEIRGSKRLQAVGSAIFSEVAAHKHRLMQQGKDIIDLGIGSPDGPPPLRIQEALVEAVHDPDLYGYPSSEGDASFRRSVAEWYWWRFGVELEPEAEVLSLMGSQDGLAHIPMALADPGDMALIPDPGYPIYSAGVLLAGVTPHYYPLRAGNEFLPRLDLIPPEIARKATYMMVNYPNNPLAAVADLSFYEELVAFARRHELLIVHDAAYSELAFDNYVPPSILEIKGAKDVSIELHSLSKSFNLAGCRLGFAVGHRGALHALRYFKSNIDYGVYRAVQRAGEQALRFSMETGYKAGSRYQQRRDLVVQGFADMGWTIPAPKATMFVWAPIPPGYTSRQISREMLQNAGVVVIPGDAFGAEGEGYVRIALVHDEAKLEKAIQRIALWYNGLSK